MFGNFVFSSVFLHKDRNVPLILVILIKTITFCQIVSN